MISGKKRYEIYQETAELSSFNTGSASSPVTPDRQPSGESILKITLTGTVGSTQSLGVVGSTNETIAVGSADTFWSAKTFTSITSISFVTGIDSAAVSVEQYGANREPMPQLKSASKYVMGSMLMPSGGGLDRLAAGEIADMNLFNVIIPSRWKDCGIQKKDWIKDEDSNYYRVESRRSYPDGHIEIQVKQAKV